MTNTTTMSAKEFKIASYNGYIAYVDFIDGKKSIAETVKELSPLMAKFGFILTVENVCNVLTVKMTNYGTVNGEKARKIKSIATFRAFVKGGWQDIANAPVAFNAGKVNPNEAKKTVKKADIIAELERLKAEKAAIQAKLESINRAAD